MLGTRSFGHVVIWFTVCLTTLLIPVQPLSSRAASRSHALQRIEARKDVSPCSCCCGRGASSHPALLLLPTHTLLPMILPVRWHACREGARPLLGPSSDSGSAL